MLYFESPQSYYRSGKQTNKQKPNVFFLSPISFQNSKRKSKRNRWNTQVKFAIITLIQAYLESPNKKQVSPGSGM